MATSLTPIEYVRSILGIMVFFVMFSISTPFIVLFLLLSFGKATNLVIKYFSPFIAYPVLWVIGIQFNVIHHSEQVEPPVIYTVNHSSTLDLLTMIALALPNVRFVAKWELQYNPLFFIVGRITGQIFIQRKKSDKAVKRLRASYKRIKKDKLSVMVAPEGSRKHPGIIGPFKKGGFRMAIDLGIPIVPIYFKGSRELSLGSSLLTKKGTINAHIHPPIETKNWQQETIDEHIKEVRAMYLKWAGVS
ncbi:MAG: 1-acyl-sn-glycerol-3-phosphate acyltransferase [Gracilimonas sp.]|uniref:lysophospholipid acyltransferase family protein n=1 Tax=Gracilimonas sp. TaxID=1974203 RepID=UPI0037530BEF|nr:1-acyl-sn-glycerol-3-phosphate acyltransferase [Gracilimonas sp.]